ncbi:MAG: hypothetical protein CM15mP102_12870 [Flavobacteriales bacterium]|nr:MAG: hypothetical protein CM15mP102_12870 [Flavobacteriales bacterium]
MKVRLRHTIANFVQDQGGFLSYDDLKNHNLNGLNRIYNYRGYDVGSYPKWSRYAALQILNLLEGMILDHGFWYC